MDIEKVLEFIKQLHKEKEEAVLRAYEAKSILESKPKHRSESIDLLATALSKAQSEMPVAKKDSDNPYFKSKYADLEEIVSVSRPSLTKYGLSVEQPIITDDNGAMMLHTVLMHSSGQWTESTMRVVPPKNDIQAISSYITYLKRVSYSALVCVVAQEEDDDAELAIATTRETFAKGTALNHKYNPKENSSSVVTREQLDELQLELEDYPDIAEQVLDGLKIQSIADMPKDKYSAAIRRIREIKLTRSGK